MLKITNTKGLQGKPMNILIFGDPGTGKTRLAGSAQESDIMKPIIYADTEGGTLSLHNYDIDKIDVRSIDPLNELHTLLAKPDNKYRTVVIDSLTELYKIAHKEILAKKNLDGPTIQTWGLANDMIFNIVRKYRDLPVNFIATCWADEDEDKLGRTKIANDLPGQSKKNVAGQFDIIGHLTLVKNKAGQVERQIQFAGDGKVVVRDRFDLLPPVMVNATLPQILGILTKGQE